MSGQAFCFLHLLAYVHSQNTFGLPFNGVPQLPQLSPLSLTIPSVARPSLPLNALPWPPAPLLPPGSNSILLPSPFGQPQQPLAADFENVPLEKINLDPEALMTVVSGVGPSREASA